MEDEVGQDGRTATAGTDLRRAPPAGVPPVGDVEDFLSLVAHELRTPLAVIESAAETVGLLLDGREVDRAQLGQVAEVVRRHSRLASRLVDRLDFAHRVGRGTVELVTARLDLAKLVEQVVDDVSAFVLPDRAVSVSTAGAVTVVVDPSTISEILFNLLSNADRYSAAGRSIEVRVTHDERIARVVVRDQGFGVAPGDTEAIFAPYVQSGPRRGGVGLGLYVSRGLARAHRGELSVRPATDQGSEFVLELPVAAP